MPYAEVMTAPPTTPVALRIWKLLGGKDDPATRCGVPLPSITKSRYYAYVPGHYRMNADGSLKELACPIPEEPDVLWQYSEYATFEDLPVARKVVLTLFENGTSGPRERRMVESQTISAIEILERDLTSLPPWSKEVTPETIVDIYKDGENTTRFPYSAERLKKEGFILQDDPEENLRVGRMAFGGIAGGVLAASVLGAFWHRMRGVSG